MKEAEKEANRLIELYSKYECYDDEAIEMSIIDVSNTIEAVKSIADRKYDFFMEVKKILEDKLK